MASLSKFKPVPGRCSSVRCQNHTEDETGHIHEQLGCRVNDGSAFAENKNLNSQQQLQDAVLEHVNHERPVSQDKTGFYCETNEINEMRCHFKHMEESCLFRHENGTSRDKSGHNKYKSGMLSSTGNDGSNRTENTERKKGMVDIKDVLCSINTENLNSDMVPEKDTMSCEKDLSGIQRKREKSGCTEKVSFGMTTDRREQKDWQNFHRRNVAMQSIFQKTSYTSACKENCRINLTKCICVKALDIETSSNKTVYFTVFSLKEMYQSLLCWRIIIACFRATLKFLVQCIGWENKASFSGLENIHLGSKNIPVSNISRKGFFTSVFDNLYIISYNSYCTIFPYSPYYSHDFYVEIPISHFFQSSCTLYKLKDRAHCSFKGNILSVILMFIICHNRMTFRSLVYNSSLPCNIVRRSASLNEEASVVLKYEDDNDCWKGNDIFSHNERVVTLHEQVLPQNLCSRHEDRRCKQFYGDVDLEKQSFENDQIELREDREKANRLKNDKTDDETSDSLKRTVRSNTELPPEDLERFEKIIVAPASLPKGKTKKRPSQVQNDSTEVDQVPSVRSSSLRDEETSGSHADGFQIESAASNRALQNDPQFEAEVDIEMEGFGATGGLVQTDSKSCSSTGNASSKENLSNSVLVGKKDDLYGDRNSQISVYHAAVQHNGSRTSSLSSNARGQNGKISDTPDIKGQSQLRPSEITDEAENVNSPSTIITEATDTNSTHMPSPNVEDSEIQRFEPLMHIINKIADGQRVPPQITMQYEMLRFCTLRSFPKENKPFITRLAGAGFYYANSGDEVVCYSCARRKSNWQETDNPMDIHRQMNPNCKFLLRNSEVNVPIKASSMSATFEINTSSSYSNSAPLNRQNMSNTVDESTAAFNSRRNMNEDGAQNGSANTNTSQRNGFENFTQRMNSPVQSRAHGNFVHTTSTTTDRQPQSTVTSSGSVFGQSNNSLLALAAQSAVGGASASEGSAGASSKSTPPKYPKYASKTVRIASFNDCGHSVVSADSLAESGFFYAGFGDCVRCFQCGVGLRHWSDEDDPWIEHSRWSKDCSYVREMKGQEFVNLVQMAVQYSQNQNENGENQNTNIPGSNEGAEGGEDVEHLMHTDAAQSVLEMGYLPNIIRRAIRSCMQTVGQQGLTAANLMEKIFEIEESDNASSALQNGDSSEQSHVTQNRPFSNPQQRVGNEAVTEPREVNNTERQNTTGASLSNTRSGTEGSSLSTNVSGPDSTRATRKSQLLEQKKLKEENEKLKQQSICTKCKRNDVCIVFLPCGHLVTCEECAPTVRYCTVEACGKYIKGTVRTYLA